MSAAAVVVVGSLFNETWWVRTTWSTRRRRPQLPPRITGFSAWTDDSWTWAFPTLARGLSAFGLLVCGALLTMNSGDSGPWRRAIGASLGIVAAVCLATASVVAGQYWQPLLAEQAAGGVVRDGVLIEGLTRIAPGLPVVTIAGGLGALACLVFVAGLLTARRDAAQSSAEIPLYLSSE